ncbi:uncharacterized protein Z520_10597 [Fonsecaea multimorphosa CBS 102226]|uniref:Uncharacterized protein n=1 Tax=Fonsecaea multimorphosa CBS 102226 TaxID=1442371 RepID=A0A0D2I936_9EURO|nr:uncharacterized protein Z520_10597 [Fonsecaea multimorphosa CBS 102226]KIX93691.1 hypothetical protein Z520_10597 [Fonsecaea multimorphosa CBS 102226]OAL19801.1 hypothetical protein AYO22_09328 [Fonsecaea multimorphosa]
MKAHQPWFPRDDSTDYASLRHGDAQSDKSACSTGPLPTLSQPRQTHLRKLPVFGCFSGPAESPDGSGNGFGKEEDASRTLSSSPASSIPDIVASERKPGENSCSSLTQSEHALAVSGHGPPPPPPTANSAASAWTDEQSVKTIAVDKIRRGERLDEGLENIAAGLPAESVAAASACSLIQTFPSTEHLERRVFVPSARQPGPHEPVVRPQRTYTSPDQIIGPGAAPQTVIPLNTDQSSFPSPRQVVLSPPWESSSPGPAVAGPRRSASCQSIRSRRRGPRSIRSCSPTLQSRIPLVYSIDSDHARNDCQVTTTPRTESILSTITTTDNNNKSTASKMSSYTMTYSPTFPHRRLILSPKMTVPASTPPPPPAQDIHMTHSRSLMEEADFNIDDILSALLIPIREEEPTPPPSALYSSDGRSSSMDISNTSNEDSDDDDDEEEEEEEEGEEKEKECGVRVHNDPFISIIYPGRGEVPERLREPKNKLLAALVEESHPCDDEDDAGAEAKDAEEQDFADTDFVTVARADHHSYVQMASLCRAHRASMPCEKGKSEREIDHQGPLRQRRVTHQWQTDNNLGSHWVDVAAEGLSAGRANKFGAVGQQVTSGAVPPPVPVIRDDEKAVWTPRGWKVVPRVGPGSLVHQLPKPWTTEKQFGF